MANTPKQVVVVTRERKREGVRGGGAWRGVNVTYHQRETWAWDDAHNSPILVWVDERQTPRAGPQPSVFSPLGPDVSYTRKTQFAQICTEKCSIIMKTLHETIGHSSIGVQFMCKAVYLNFIFKCAIFADLCLLLCCQQQQAFNIFTTCEVQGSCTWPNCTKDCNGRSKNK